MSLAASRRQNRGGSAIFSLANIHPFKLLPDSALAKLESESREIHAEKNALLFEEGDSSDHVYIIKTGRVRLAHLRVDGSVRGLCMLGEGDTFCCLPALDGGTYPATASAAVPSVIVRFPGVLFRQLIESEVDFGRATIMQFCGRLRENGCEACSVPDDASSKLASRILAMRRKFGDEIPLTRRELGELAGTTVETAIRILKDFEKAGLVELGRGKLRVLDAAAIEARMTGNISAAEDSLELRDGSLPQSSNRKASSQ